MNHLKNTRKCFHLRQPMNSFITYYLCEYFKLYYEFQLESTSRIKFCLCCSTVATYKDWEVKSNLSILWIRVLMQQSASFIFSQIDSVKIGAFYWLSHYIQDVQKTRHFSRCRYLLVIRRDTVNPSCFSYIDQKCMLWAKEWYFLLCSSVL